MRPQIDQRVRDGRRPTTPVGPHTEQVGQSDNEQKGQHTDLGRDRQTKGNSKTNHAAPALALSDAHRVVEGQGDKEGGRGIHGEIVGILNIEDAEGEQERCHKTHACAV